MPIVFADPQKGPADQWWSDAEALRNKGVDNGTESRHGSRLPSLDQHAKRAADGQAPRLRDVSPQTLIDEEQVSLQLFGQQNCGRFSRV